MQTYAEDSLTPKQVKANRIKLFVLFVIPLFVLGAAYVMFYGGIGVPTSTTNKGELVQPPIELSGIAFNDMSEDVSLYSVSQGYWNILLPVLEPCTEYCQERLYTTRQVHLRLGKKGDTLSRAVVLTHPPSPEFSLFMTENHPFTKILVVSSGDYQSVFSAINPSEGDYVLVDPRGWLMMAYREQHDGEDLLTDLKKLLR